MWKKYIEIWKKACYNKKVKQNNNSDEAIAALQVLGYPQKDAMKAVNSVDCKDLSVEDIIGTKESINMYTLEWYWEDDDKNDTIVGRQNIDQEYTLHLEIYANELN